jgi:hypothetical protein
MGGDPLTTCLILVGQSHRDPIPPGPNPTRTQSHRDPPRLRQRRACMLFVVFFSRPLLASLRLLAFVLHSRVVAVCRWVVCLWRLGCLVAGKALEPESRGGGGVARSRAFAQSPGSGHAGAPHAHMCCTKMARRRLLILGTRLLMALSLPSPLNLTPPPTPPPPPPHPPTYLRFCTPPHPNCSGCSRWRTCPRARCRGPSRGRSPRSTTNSSTST